jgi:hypothetical protein
MVSMTYCEKSNEIESNPIWPAHPFHQFVTRESIDSKRFGNSRCFSLNLSTMKTRSLSITYAINFSKAICSGLYPRSSIAISLNLSIISFYRPGPS